MLTTPHRRTAAPQETFAYRSSISKLRPLLLPLWRKLRCALSNYSEGRRSVPSPGEQPGSAYPPKPVRVLPLEVSTPAATFGCSPEQAAPFFTLSKGRGRIGRPRPNSVRGLPRNQPRVTQVSPCGSGLEPAPDAIRGVRVAASVKQPGRSRAPASGAALLQTLLGERLIPPFPAEPGEQLCESRADLRGGQSLPSPRGEAGSAYPPKPVRGLPRTQATEQLRASQRRRSCSLSIEGEGWGEGGCLGEAARPKSSTFRQGRPASHCPGGEAEPAPDSIPGCRRLRRKSVRGLPGTHSRIVQRSSA